ncbi:hypothetical protein FJTKL_13498 [Diaporthe vaccinii]|uniref:Transcription factor domain-containing protein n=1 Tax=Diaporthe vaccinii TaxID=105482 RepID=A0ABR4EA08_9PEZI
MWISPTVFDKDGALGAPFHWSNGSDDLNMSDGLLLGGGHLEVGQNSDLFDLFNPSQPVLEDISLAGPTPPDCGHEQGVPDLQSRLAGLHLDPGFDVVEFSGVKLLSKMSSVNSRHDFNSEHMERIIVQILSRLDIPLFNSMTMDTNVGQEPSLDCLQSYLKAFSGHPYMGANYTEKNTLFSIFDDVMVTKSADAASVALVDGAIATGAKLERQLGANKSRKASIAQSYFEKALGILPKLGAKSSITIFKATLTLLAYAMRWKPDQVPGLLVDCTAHVQALRLNSRRSLSSICSDPQDETQLKQGFWLFYTIEKQYSMRMGGFSTLPDDHIDHPLPSMTESSDLHGKDLVTQCLFGRLCSYIIQRLHGREARNLPYFDSRDECLRLLEAWKDLSMSVNNHGGQEGSLRELCTRVQYFELLLCIYAQEMSKPGQLVSLEKIQGSILRASQEILYLISDIGDPIVASEWYV